MKKILLALFILLDISILAGTAFFLYNHLNSQTHAMTVSTPPLAAIAVSTGTVASTPVVALSSPTAFRGEVGGAADSGVRKILFSYRNPKAKQVSIRADFTGWKGEPMQKDPATGRWVYQANLTAGEYAYCFTVDDKTFRDPANKRTKQIGRTFVSSIVVKPSAEK